MMHGFTSSAVQPILWFNRVSCEGTIRVAVMSSRQKCHLESMIKTPHISCSKPLDDFMALAIEKGDVGGSTSVLVFLFGKEKMEIIPFGY